MTVTNEALSGYVPDLELIDAVEDAYSGEMTDTHLWVGEYSEPSVRVLGFIEGGHGFTVWTGTADPTREVRTTCRYCGGPLPLPDREWFCEFGGEAQEDCGCNWCEHRRLSLAYEALERGRPRVQCGKANCVRAHNRERKRKERIRDSQPSPPTPGQRSTRGTEPHDDGPGSCHAVFPTLRKRPGGYADPTGDMAVRLAVEPPAVWELAFRLEWHEENETERWDMLKPAPTA